MRKILYVDDDALNRDILRELLCEGGYDVVEADDGDTALQRLQDTSGIDAILLDRMMPRMGGIEVLKAVKADARFADIPVIMQTAATSRDQILQGIKAGVYYYLTKPYEDQMLLAIVGAALQDAAQKQRLREEVAQHRSLMGLLEQARFRFRTPQEARSLAFLIANCFPEPEAAIYGLHEMLSNAIEHGNLGITYQEKTRLILEGRLREEIERRLALPANREKWAWLSFETDGKTLRARIRDQGNGFDWRPFLDISPERAMHPHGRGIATALRMSFSSLDYVGCGNEVVCTFVVDEA
ncbi:histidine kinase [Rhodomicrobium udaipurense JA643]|uniref:Response regulator n=1 Tax=Rhodomicrobium udaipurense TaxID=1202716 RepID=A0A8I1GAX5_9HYPH|nr:response regulator [Rhodomicrobium udaipurense]KAI96184.1 histidine kinase [Rhodomicrobium udaipurense JA643]MBJ7543722.1 response regulator [Rhodomicrobium udaipurense]